MSKNNQQTTTTVKPMSDSNRFKFWEITAARPLEATAKILFITGVAIPVGASLIWGVYDNSNFASVIGIAGRRAGGAAIQETRPIGESLLNGTTGKGLRPGSPQQATPGFDYSIRPGAVPANNPQYNPQY